MHYHNYLIKYHQILFIFCSLAGLSPASGAALPRSCYPVNFSVLFFLSHSPQTPPTFDSLS